MPQGTYMLFLDLTEYCRRTGRTLDEVLKAGWTDMSSTTEHRQRIFLFSRIQNKTQGPRGAAEQPFARGGLVHA